MNYFKQTTTALCLTGFLLLTSCATAPEPKAAPCNTFGQNCEPKVAINQWRTNAQQ